ncbi:MAG TPA: tetratricopeptide repeat protein [Deltaproteobacteria bacterium]|nr:tetratricopeptide repeat protein [Deltaproteobacteria bacterium]
MVNALSRHEHRENGHRASAAEAEALEFARNGLFAEAVESFTAALQLDPHRPGTYRLRGIAYSRLGLHEQAVKDFDKAIEQDADCPGSFFERGTAKMCSGDYGGAVEDFSRCLSLDPDHAAAYASRAGARVRNGQYEEALEDMETALSISPEQPGYLHNRAVILASLGRFGEAIRDYERVIALDPKSAGSYNNLAWILATADDPAYRDCRKAISYAVKALELGMNGAWMDTLAAAYAECGDFEKAVAAERSAYRLSRPPNRSFLDRIRLYEKGETYAERVLQGHGRERRSGEPPHPEKRGTALKHLILGKEE